MDGQRCIGLPPARTAGDSGRFAGTLATHCDRRWLQPGVDGLARGIGGGVDRDDLLRPGEPGAYEVESLPVWSERHDVRVPPQNDGLALVFPVFFVVEAA